MHHHATNTTANSQPICFLPLAPFLLLPLPLSVFFFPKEIFSLALNIFQVANQFNSLHPCPLWAHSLFMISFLSGGRGGNKTVRLLQGWAILGSDREAAALPVSSVVHSMEGWGNPSLVACGEGICLREGCKCINTETSYNFPLHPDLPKPNRSYYV